MIPDRFTVTNPQKFYAGGAPQMSATRQDCAQDYVFDNRTGSLTICENPPSYSKLQDSHGGFNITA